MSESKQLTPQESFEKKIADRLKSDIGDLIPDEVLSGLVQKAIEDAFFKSPSRYTTNSRLVDMVRELMQAEVKKNVDKYVEENAEKFFEMYKEQTELDMGKVMLKALVDTINQPVYNMQWQMQEKFGNLLNG